MSLSNEDKKWIQSEFAKLPTKVELQGELARLYRDIQRLISTYHPEEAERILTLKQD